ncbi:MAG TPA: hypothetical protein VMZ71_08370, partial [Gemmataceae bacterium]|nr:hypothetical protein [Gemmataceae bacterium]
MLRCALFAVAVCAIVPNTRAADPTGNWILSYALPNGDSALCIVKVETAGGKSTATVAFAPKGTEFAVSDFTATDKQISFSVKQTVNVQGRQIVNDLKFVGTPGKDGKVVLGNIGPATAAARRAKLTATDKTELDVAAMTARSPAGNDYVKVTQLSSKPLQVQIKMQQEKDAEAKKGLQKELVAAREEVAEKLPGLLRDVIDKHPDTVAAAESALTLFRNPQAKLTPDEAAKMADIVRKQSTPYGPRFEVSNMAAAAEAVANRKDLAPVVLPIIEPVAKGLTDEINPADQVKVLSLYKSALTTAGKTDEAKAIDARLTKIEAKLDAEYLATVPPFKPTPYAGRKTAGANQVTVFELFTGAQCPPCVGADVAFDALMKTYKPTDVLLIQYHVHIPGPDPLTSPESEKRFAYYREAFPEGMPGAPSTVFNGKPSRLGGGGTIASGEGKSKEYADIINPLLEKKTDVKVTGKATRTGDKIDIAVSVDGADGEDTKLRLLVVEESVKYVGGNQIRFHHHVVRAMPGGVEGVAVKDKAFKHTETADVAAIKASLAKYLDDYAA